jgi:hypothetical protein
MGCIEYTISIEIVLEALDRLLGDEAQVKLGSVRLEMVQLLVQDWCTVCVERTAGSEIVLEAPDGTPW